MLRRQFLLATALTTASGFIGASDAAQAVDVVVLFSHGLGGTRSGSTVWGEAWANAGFVVVHLQHPGSDLAAVRQARAGTGLASVANGRELVNRLQDVMFVLDEVARRHAAGKSRWGQVRPPRVGMSGHSFGAHTTLGMAGQRYPEFAGVDEPRLAAFIAFSPALPPEDASEALAPLTRPVLTLTGARDGDIVGNGATPERRAATFDALPPGRKARLVLQDADHMTFAGQTDRSIDALRRNEPLARELQPRHHEALAALSTD